MANKKKEEKSNKFLSGALIGAVLGVAVGVLATSKTGKEMGKEAKEKMAEFYKYLSPRLKEAKEMGEKEYKLFVNKALVAYGKNKKFSKKDIEDMKKEANASWKHFKKLF